jgi:tetratricopeptide (TPR) repeat protein
MMMIFVALLIGAVCWAAIALAGRMAPAFRIPLAASIMLGLSGYLLLGSPALSGAPKPPPERAGFGDAIGDPRKGLADMRGPAAMWLGLSDGLLRAGNTELAAEALQQGLRVHPRDVDLWIGFGNALVAHSNGMMTPAAEMAFQRAANIQPDHPAPQFFFGLALAQGGDIEGARRIWQALLDRSPPDAPWREDLTGRLAMLPPASPTTAPPASPTAAPAASTPPTTPSPAAPAASPLQGD